MAVGVPLLVIMYHNPIPMKGDVAEIMSQYGMDPYLFFSLDPKVFTSQTIVVFIIALLVSIYPLVQIFRLNMVKALRR